MAIREISFEQIPMVLKKYKESLSPLAGISALLTTAAGLFVILHQNYDYPVFLFFAFAFLGVSIIFLLTYFQKVSGLKKKRFFEVSGTIAEKRVRMSNPKFADINFEYEYDPNGHKIIQKAKIKSKKGEFSKSKKIVSSAESPKQIDLRAEYQFKIDDQFVSVSPIVFFNYNAGQDFLGYLTEDKNFLTDSEYRFPKFSFGNSYFAK